MSKEGEGLHGGASTHNPPPKGLKPMKDLCQSRYTPRRDYSHGDPTSEQVLAKRDYGLQMSPCQRQYYYNVIMIICYLLSYYLI